MRLKRQNRKGSKRETVSEASGRDYLQIEMLPTLLQGNEFSSN